MRIKLFEDFEFNPGQRSSDDRFLTDCQNYGMVLCGFTKSELSWMRRSGIIKKLDYKFYVNTNVNGSTLVEFQSGIINNDNGVRIYKMMPKSGDDCIYYTRDIKSRFYYKSDDFEEVKNCPLLS